MVLGVDWGLVRGLSIRVSSRVCSELAFQLLVTCPRMNVNRLEFYFRALEPDTSNKQDYHLDLAYEGLVEAQPSDFARRLDQVVRLITEQAGNNSAEFHRLVDRILEPCFDQCLLTGRMLDEYFQGEDREAHRAMCVSSILYVLGWELISASARLWCEN